MNNFIINNTTFFQNTFETRDEKWNRFSIQNDVFNYFIVLENLTEQDKKFLIEINKHNNLIIVDNIKKQIVKVYFYIFFTTENTNILNVELILK